MTNTEKIIELNKIWYPLVSGEYHKERDCHFYIIIDYHYGEKCTFIVEHKGYIVHNYENSEWDTQEEAEQELIRLLSESILNEVNWYLEHYGEEGWDQHDKYDKEQLLAIISKVNAINK